MASTGAEVRDRELQLYETNKRLRDMSPQELDKPETRRQIERQADAEQTNGRRLANLNELGKDLLKQAARNPEIGVGHLDKWAEMLQILADNCVKAIFFTIGQQARANPEGVHKLAAAGHTIATHTQDHPLTMDHMPIEKARQQIDDGIASVSAPLSDPSLVAPFFRIPI
jgi:hypothetical protein